MSPKVEIIRLIPFAEQRRWRRAGYAIKPHPHGAHRGYGLIASKPGKPRKKRRGK